MAWVIETSSHIGNQSITENSTTQNHPLGTIVQARDATLGVGEFIYLKGVASTTVGSIVTYDDNWQTALATTTVAAPSQPLAVAMSANVASEYGWYQIGGMAVASKGESVSFVDGAALAAGSGLAIAITTGNVIQGAIVRAVASATSGGTTVPIAISRPHDATDVS